MIIDHSGIDPEQLGASSSMARLAYDEESHVYPWLDSYPKEGQSVYYDRRLWCVRSVEAGPGADEPTAFVKLAGTVDGLYVEHTAARYELRPVTWTQADEDRMGRE